MNNRHKQVSPTHTPEKTACAARAKDRLPVLARLKQWLHRSAPVQTQAPDAFPPPAPESFLRIALEERGGLGDALFQLTFIKEIRKLFDKPVRIDFYTRSYGAFQHIPFVDYCADYDPEHRPLDRYDVYISCIRCYYFLKIDQEKVQQFSPRFYRFCQDCLQLTATHFKNPNSNLFNQYALLFGKNRLEQPDTHSILGVTRHTPTYMAFDPAELDFLRQHGLENTPYITLCRAVDGHYTPQHPKLWPAAHYNELIAQLKKAYPSIKLVQIGAANTDILFDQADINLVGKTSYEQAKVLLKYALLHIDNEGGLVHLRHQLQGRSVVLFGPTSPDIFGYEDNLNIRSIICRPCDWVSLRWTRGCLRGITPAPCMQAITPSTVFNKIKKYMDALPHFISQILPDTQVQDILSSASALQIAILGRQLPAWLSAAVTAGHKITVYAPDLSQPDEVFARNCFFCRTAQKQGFTAEYGTPYNIPAKSEKFDLIYGPDLSQEKYPAYVVQELLRILKEKGHLFVYATKEITLQVENKQLTVGRQPICITRHKTV